MPFLNDDELNSLHKTIDTAQDKLNETNDELEEIKESLHNSEEKLKKTKKSKSLQNIILSILAGIGLALAFYFYNNSSNSINIENIKKAEATRILDSISANSYTTQNNSNTNNSFEDSIESVKSNISGEKIYSVQVGAFTQNKYALLSETLAGITSNGDMFKYSIGLFKTLKEAQNFRRELVKIGFRDAFVASYIDGIRQEIEHPNK